MILRYFGKSVFHLIDIKNPIRIQYKPYLKLAFFMGQKERLL